MIQTRKFKKTLTWTLALGLLGISLGSFEAMARQGGPMKDKDGDGVVSKAEFLEVVEVRFQKKDTDGNGVITKEEVLKKAEEKFTKIDTNGDGVLSQDELRQKRHKGHRGPPTNK